MKFKTGFAAFLALVFSVSFQLTGCRALTIPFEPQIHENVSFPAGRDKYLWPFASDSIWNMPIGSGAVFSGPPVPADKIQPPDGFGIDNAPIILAPTAPLRPVMSCNWPIQNPPINPAPTAFSWPIPDDYLAVPGDGNWVGTQPNQMGGLLLPDGRTIQEFNYFGRFTKGGNIYIAGGGIRSTQDIYGSGQPPPPFFGGHGGSGLSGFGGVLRRGELTSPETNHIRHAFKITIDTSRWCSRENNLNAWRWPASTADGEGLGDTYGINASGYTPFCKMGSLLAIPSKEALSTLLATLETIPAKKLAWTLRFYGAYIADAGGHDSGWGQNLLEVEYGVHLDMKQIGINMDTCAGNAGYVDTPWNRDMVKVFTELREVQNHTPTTRGGGGVPLQPLAPPITN